MCMTFKVQDGTPRLQLEECLWLGGDSVEAPLGQLISPRTTFTSMVVLGLAQMPRDLMIFIFSACRHSNGFRIGTRVELEFRIIL